MKTTLRQIIHVLFVISNIEKILKDTEHKDILCTETQSEDENRPLARSNAAQEGGAARWEHWSISIRDPAETYFTNEKEILHKNTKVKEGVRSRLA